MSGIDDSNQNIKPREIMCICGNPVSSCTCNTNKPVRFCSTCGKLSGSCTCNPNTTLQPVLCCSICGNPVRFCTCRLDKLRCPICGRIHSGSCLQLRCPICGGNHPVSVHFVIPKPYVQKVIPEVSIGKFLEEGWEFKVQLQSGSVIMEKAIDVESITNTVLEQTRKQIEDTIEKTDVESITDKAMGQAIKQIEEAVVKEKQRLLKE